MATTNGFQKEEQGVPTRKRHVMTEPTVCISELVLTDGRA
jgi:hypothetical protein